MLKTIKNVIKFFTSLNRPDERPPAPQRNREEKAYDNGVLHKRILWGEDSKHTPILFVLFGSGERYTYYRVLKGRGSHFPCMKGESSDLEWRKMMSIKEGPIILPSYYSYEETVQEVENKGLGEVTFRLLKNQNELLELHAFSIRFKELLVDIISYPNLYIRKKKLSELIKMDPPKEIYEVILKRGSTEVIAGLFLELGKMKNSVLCKEAKELIEGEIDWAEPGYAEGVKRCASIYIHSLDHHLLEERASLLCHYLEETDTSIIQFKNIIQEAECYQLPDILGKAAYQIDGPRLVSHLRIKGKGKAINYFRRYLRRIFDTYAKTEPDKFIEAMKRLLTSYTKQDYLGTVAGDFRYNYFIKYYLYQDFNEKAPTGWKNWRARQEWFLQDQLLKVDRRCEYKKEIWDNHLEDVVYIAVHGKIEHVVKACHYILKDSPNAKDFIDKISYGELLMLCDVIYIPMADRFTEIISERLSQLHSFDAGLMLQLMKCTNKRVQELGKAFLYRTNGVFAARHLADFLLLENIDEWLDIYHHNLKALNADAHGEFIGCILENVEKFIELSKEPSDNIKETLLNSLARIKEMSRGKKCGLLSRLIRSLERERELPEWMASLVQDILFVFDYEELIQLLNEVKREPQIASVSQGNKRLLSVIESIRLQKVTSDMEVVDILEYGTSRMIQVLVDIFHKDKESLGDRLSTLLIMLESSIPSLNQLAEEIFDKLKEENQRKLHAMVLDSPVSRVSSFGLMKLESIYKGLIPKTFMIQMLESREEKVKAYISDKMHEVIEELGKGDEELFIYYLKTLLYMPNKLSKSKDNLCEAVPKFVLRYKERRAELEAILLELAGSNVLSDAERALVTLAKMREEVMQYER